MRNISNPVSVMKVHNGPVWSLAPRINTGDIISCGEDGTIKVILSKLLMGVVDKQINQPYKILEAAHPLRKVAQGCTIQTTNSVSNNIFALAGDDAGRCHSIIQNVH